MSMKIIEMVGVALTVHIKVGLNIKKWKTFPLQLVFLLSITMFKLSILLYVHI